ncbi:MAG: hypothetical protein WB565_07205 [Acidimicrobiales bacterium]
MTVLVVGLMLASTAGAFITPSTSGAAPSVYYWYTQHGWKNQWSTRTKPGSRHYASDTVRAEWLGTPSGSSARMLGGSCTTCGGIVPDIATTISGDYCNEYRLPVFATDSAWPFGQYTGLYPHRPSLGFQETDGASTQSSTCQAESNYDKWGWGQWIQPADNPTNCGNCGANGTPEGCGDCGIEHYVSFAGTADYPWSTSFGDPELTVQNKVHVGAYSDHCCLKTNGMFAWHFLCPVVGADHGGIESYIELCADEWQSQSTTTSGAIVPTNDSAGCQTSHIVEAIGGLNPSNPTGSFFTAILGSGQSSTVSTGALGDYWWEATVTEQNLQNVINAIPSLCKANYDTTVSDYQLIGIEDGIESGDPCAPGAACHFYLNYFGDSESLLQAWTAY